jgi:hypothetical protein
MLVQSFHDPEESEEVLLDIDEIMLRHNASVDKPKKKVKKDTS